MAQVHRTAQSRLDYQQIFIYIAEDNFRAAERLLHNFDATLEMIAQMPGAGAARPELGKNIRSFPVGQYLIFYRPAKDGIELLRVLHGARNIRRIFRKRKSE